MAAGNEPFRVAFLRALPGTWPFAANAEQSRGGRTASADVEALRGRPAGCLLTGDLHPPGEDDSLAREGAIARALHQERGRSVAGRRSPRPSRLRSRPLSSEGATEDVGRRNGILEGIMMLELDPEMPGQIAERIAFPGELRPSSAHHRLIIEPGGSKTGRSYLWQALVIAIRSNEPWVTMILPSRAQANSGRMSQNVWATGDMIRLNAVNLDVPMIEPVLRDRSGARSCRRSRRSQPSRCRSGKWRRNLHWRFRDRGRGSS